MGSRMEFDPHLLNHAKGRLLRFVYFCDECFDDVFPPESFSTEFDMEDNIPRCQGCGESIHLLEIRGNEVKLRPFKQPTKYVLDFEHSYTSEEAILCWWRKSD